VVKKKTVGCWVEGVDDVFPGQNRHILAYTIFWGKFHRTVLRNE